VNVEFSTIEFINYLSEDRAWSHHYATLMKDELDDLAGHLLRALISIEENKKGVAQWYYKKVKAKEFPCGDLVWKFKVWKMVS